jgi:peptidyl-prolyl cis-trans isomerase C
MKKLLVTTMLVSSMLFSSAVFADSDPVVAKYSGKEVRKSYVEEKVKSMLNGELPYGKKDIMELDPQVREQIIRSVVMSEIVTKKAKDSGIDNNSDVKKKIEIAKEQVVQNEYLVQEAKKLVTDSMMKESYNKFAESLKGKEEFKLSHLLYQDEKEATEAAKEFKADVAKFDAKIKELADKKEQNKGGELGVFKTGEMFPAIEEKVKNVKAGGISDPVKTDFGWHVLKIDQRKNIAVPTYEEKKEEIRNSLERMQVQKVIENLVKSVGLEVIDPVTKVKK